MYSRGVPSGLAEDPAVWSGLHLRKSSKKGSPASGGVVLGGCVERRSDILQVPFLPNGVWSTLSSPGTWPDVSGWPRPPMRVVPERGAFEPAPVHSQGSPRGSVVYKAHVWDFPGGPVVKTPHFQGRDSIPGWEARSHTLSGTANRARSCPEVSVPVLGCVPWDWAPVEVPVQASGQPPAQWVVCSLGCAATTCSEAALQVQKGPPGGTGAGHSGKCHEVRTWRPGGGSIHTGDLGHKVKRLDRRRSSNPFPCLVAVIKLGRGWWFHLTQAAAYQRSPVVGSLWDAPGALWSGPELARDQKHFS